MTVDPSRVMSTADWREIHDVHRTPGFDHARGDVGHPSGEWIRLRCTCGATHVTTTVKAEGSEARKGQIAGTI